MAHNESGEYLSVDRIEGETAVLENDKGESVEVSVRELPAGMREGDCLLKKNGVYTVDMEETGRRRKYNIELFNSLLDKQG